MTDGRDQSKTNNPTGDGHAAPDNPASATAAVEAQLAPILKDLPVPTQREIKHFISEKFEAFLSATVTSGGPKLDPDTVKILAASAEKESDYKFKYLTQKQTNEALESQRKHEFVKECHRDNVRMFVPVLGTSLVVFVGCIVAGITFIAQGREAIGSAILSGVFSAAFGYLGGLGTANFFKSSRTGPQDD